MGEVVNLTLEDENGVLYKMPIIFWDIELHAESEPYEAGFMDNFRYFKRGETKLKLEGHVTGQMTRVQR